MEAKDLMIGNWVLHKGEPYQIRQLGIFGETLWDEISKCYDSGASSDDDVIIEMKYEQ